VDCGFFPTPQKDGGRLAYCLEKNERVARKLYLQVHEGKLAVQVDVKNMNRTVKVYTGFVPGECK
jgi:hypothetical protein